MYSIKKQFSDHHKILRLLGTVLIIFLAVLTISTLVSIQNKIKQSKYIGQEIESKNTITVSGTGEIYAKPDLALATFSVQTEKKTVAQAMTENTKKMNQVIDFMKQAGIEEKDLKTTNFNIYPLYEYRTETSIIPVTGRRVLVGYEIIQSLEVKMRDLEKVGQIIEGATEAGANQVGDLQFTIDQEDELKKQARQEAISKAKAKAEEIVDQLGINLVRIVSFNESSAAPSYYEALKEAGLGIGGGGEVPQIETGENKIEVTVSITYEIN